MTEMAFAKINFRVRDLEAALAYARDVLGAEVIHNPRPISFGQMAMVQLGGLVMEIIAPASPDSPLAKLIDARGEGVDSIGFTVPAVDKASEQLGQAGARPAERAFWEQFFAQFNVLPVTAADGVVAGQFRYARGRLGRTLHLGDALVAAVAFNAQLAIVTANPKDFASLGLDVVEVG
jgi:catechol 2,3-dioxygenase-like lactoylglutathione lyase family enzyme